MSDLHALVSRHESPDPGNAGLRCRVFASDNSEPIASGLLSDSVNTGDTDISARVLYSLPSAFTATLADVTTVSDGSFRIDNVRRR